MSTIKFIHRRPMVSMSGWAPSIASRGGFTVAYRELEDGVEYSVATCSTRDNYNKKLGRTIAQGRLECGSDHSRVEMTPDEFRDYIYKEPV